jgi:chromosome segregation ATPase
MATTTKCMSKMNKKELYEFCKKLVDENKKLQLFNNTQMDDIDELKEQDKKSTDCICNMDIKIKMLETQNQELKKIQICCDCQVGGDCEGPENCANGKRIEELQDKINELENHLDNETGALETLKEEYEQLKISQVKVPRKSMNYGYMKELEQENKQLLNKIKYLEKQNEDMSERISELEEDLEYFQNKCEIQEQKIIELEDKFAPSAYEITRLKRMIKNNTR